MQDKFDLLVDDDGDFVLDSSGDLDLATALETVQQDIKFRGLTAHGSYDIDPFFGADLISFQRLPNTRRTGDYMKANMYEALVRDGRFTRDSIVVDAVPVGREEVAIVVFVRDAVAGTEEDVLNNTPIPMVTFTVAFDNWQISAITGGLR